jgi:hypothetical protein
VRPFRLALAASLATLAVAAGGAYAEDDCPGRNTDTGALEPYVCAGVGQDGWGGPVFVYAGTCATGPCDVVTVPVEEILVDVTGVLNDVWDRIRP